MRQLDHPTLLDVCSGIGGFSLAGERAGFRTVAFAEIDPYASAVLRGHWPHVPNLGDIRCITRRSVADRVDVIAGGFPCQPASIGSGRPRGRRDDRWLWPACARLLVEFQPAYALFENTPGLLSVDGGEAFRQVLTDLDAFGYDVLWNCIPAAAVGAPHERDRLWIVAHAHDGAGATERGQHALAAPSGAGGAALALRGEVHAGRQEPVCVAGQAPGDSGAAGRWPASDWAVEPGMGRVADGIPDRVDRLRCLGNAIVPAVAEILLRGIRVQLQLNRPDRGR